MFVDFMYNKLLCLNFNKWKIILYCDQKKDEYSRLFGKYKSSTLRVPTNRKQQKYN